MSGGSYDYAFGYIDNFVDRLKDQTREDPLREAFVVHLQRVSTAMQAVEWVDSGDWGEGDEREAILKVLGPVSLEEPVREKLRSYAKGIETLLAAIEE